MSLPVVLAAAAAFTLSGSADTTIAVRPGTSLQIANLAGEVAVHGWNKNAVRIRAEADENEQVVVKLREGSLFLKTAPRGHSHNPLPSVDLDIFAPAWMDLGIEGINTDVVVEGARGKVRVETIHGEITVSGGRNQVELNTVNQDIRLTDCSGNVFSETVNGDLVLQRIDSDSVQVSTVNGEILYEGTIKDHGVYRFASHNGDIAVALPKTVSATVNVSTFSGEFASDFPVSLQETKPGRRFCFTLGRGTARVELESFQGTIHIFRPGSRGLSDLERDVIVDPKVDVKVDPKIKVKVDEKVKVKPNGKGKREYGGERDDDEEEYQAPEPPEPPEAPEAPESPEAPQAPENGPESEE